MAKSTREPPGPRADPDSWLPDFMVTALIGGLSFFLSVIVLAAVGWSAAYLGSDLAGLTGAKAGLVAGVLLGTVLIGLLVRVNRDRILARSANLYAGLWLGVVGAAIVLVMLAFAPGVALPNAVCTPGAGC